ncbi:MULTISPECIES: hypothetical protein [Chitinophagaceae]
MSFLGILLEGGYGGGDFAGLGIATFVLACIGLVLAPIFLLIALIVNLARKKDEPKSKSSNVLLKMGLISLLAGGVCLLLTAVFCSWH